MDDTMFTHCPHCDTCFRVSSEQLKLAQGSVRCGRCFGTFSALEHLVDKPPAKSDKNESGITAVAPPEPTEIVAPSKPEIMPAAQEARAERSQQIIEEIHPTPAAESSGRMGLWIVLALVLSVLFAVQYTYFNINTLSQKQSLRPTLITFCDILSCEVPLMKSPHLITLVERDIRKHPNHKETLQVNARIINNANHTQTYPVMALSLHDIKGQILAKRNFHPSEYLTVKSDEEKGIAPQQTYTISLDLVDPGTDAVGFEFEFL